MIEKIKNLIEDNTSMEVTHKQVVMGLVVVGLLMILIIFFMFNVGGPKVDKDYVSIPPGDAPAYVGN